MVANHPDDAAEIVRRVSDGTGLLADDGASVGNLVTGDAPRSYLTMATIARGRVDRRRAAPARLLRHHRQLHPPAGADGRRDGQGAVSGGAPARPIGRAPHAPRPALRRRTSRHQRRAADRLDRPRHRGDVQRRRRPSTSTTRATTPSRTTAALSARRRSTRSRGIDRAIGSLLKAARHARRAYRLVVLSDHGQCLGATFQQRYGQPLEAIDRRAASAHDDRRGHHRLRSNRPASAGASRPSSAEAPAWGRCWHAGCAARCGRPEAGGRARLRLRTSSCARPAAWPTSTSRASPTG